MDLDQQSSVSVTLASYEQGVEAYLGASNPTPHPAYKEFLYRVVSLLPAGSRMLELGTGPGPGPDALFEEHGLVVQRTDGTRAFVERLRSRVHCVPSPVLDCEYQQPVGANRIGEHDVERSAELVGRHLEDVGLMPVAQLTSYDEQKRRAWAGLADAYAQTFGPLCAHPIEQLLYAARVSRGVRVLDAGTGTGAIAAAALDRGARVTAVDPDPDMRRLAGRPAPGAVVLDGALPELALATGAFDAVVANFVLNHVGDPLASATELARVARPGGWVAISVWPRPVSELHRVWDEVVESAHLEVVPAPSLAPDLDFERSPDGLADLLTRAGLENVEAMTVRYVHCVDAEVWWSGPARGVASIGAVVEAQTPIVVARLKAQYDRLSRRYLASDGLLHLPTAAVLAYAQVP